METCLGLFPLGVLDPIVSVFRIDVNTQLTTDKINNFILSSVSDYLRILATGDSYIEFRIRRLSADTNIVMYLTKYSERRELYTNDITSIINYNNLYQYNNLIID